MVRRIFASGVAALVMQGTAMAAPYAPLIGSPNSIQHTAITTALDLTEIEPDGTLEVPGDTDFVGVGFTYWGVDGMEGQRYDVKYQKAMRVSEGSRARLLIDVPINILHVNKGPSETFSWSERTAVMGTLSLGYEVPVQPNWIVTPRVAYGVTGAGNYYGGDAELFTGSITSRYKLPQVGRGDLTIGNMLSYSKGVNTFIAKPNSFNVDSDSWTARNGVAYQLPLKQRMFGRQSSLRASYTYTFLFGEDEYTYDKVHELALTIGVRTREAEQKNRFEQMRIGLLFTHAVNQFNKVNAAFGVGKTNYDAGQIIVGYRF